MRLVISLVIKSNIILVCRGDLCCLIVVCFILGDRRLFKILGITQDSAWF